jgi:proteasome lid subunit RPN8/RPN11
MPNTPESTTLSNGSAWRGTSIGTLHEGAYQVVIAESVLEAIIDYSEQDLKRERGGFLLGSVRQADRARVEVLDFLPALDTRSHATSLTFTHETWSAMHREVETRFPGHSVIGWHHTHPDFGVFLSGYDLFIHRHFFSEPWQIALVVDPRRRELGFFQWRADQVVDCGFTCIAMDHSAE